MRNPVMNPSAPRTGVDRRPHLSKGVREGLRLVVSGLDAIPDDETETSEKMNHGLSYLRELIEWSDRQS